jgi:tetratricopeptide (TPR) repeat protein
MMDRLALDLRQLGVYARMARLAFTNDGKPAGVLTQAIADAATDPTVAKGTPPLRRGDTWRAIVVACRIGLSVWLLWHLPGWVSPGTSWGLLLVLLFVRYPRVPMVVGLLASALLVLVGPMIGAVALVRFGFDVLAVVLADRVTGAIAVPAGSNLRARALGRRLVERQRFLDEVSAKTAWALAATNDEAWQSARLEHDNRSATVAEAELARLSGAPEPPQPPPPPPPPPSLPSTESSHRSTDAILPLSPGAAGPPTTQSSAGPFEDGPIERLRDAIREAQAINAERGLAMDVLASVVAAVLCAGLVLIAPVSINSFGGKLAVTAGVPFDPWMQAVILGLATGIAVFAIRWNRQLGWILWLPVAFVALIVAGLAPQMLIGFIVIAGELVAQRMIDSSGALLPPLPRPSALATPGRLRLAVDSHFARLHQERGFEALALVEFDVLAAEYTQRGLDAEAAWCRLAEASLHRQLGAFTEAAATLDAAGPVAGRAAAVACLERGLIAAALADTERSTKLLTEAANRALEVKDVWRLSRALNGLSSLAVQSDLAGAELIARRARRVAASLPAGHRLLLENELTLIDVLLDHGRHDDATQAAQDVIDLPVPRSTSAILRKFLGLFGAAHVLEPEEWALTTKAMLGQGAAALGAGDPSRACGIYSDVVKRVRDTSFPLEAAEAYRGLSISFERIGGYERQALSTSLTALTILTNQRHRLANQPDRARWFARHREVLDSSLRFCGVLGLDDIALEVIEIARTQAVPRAEAGPAVAIDGPRVEEGEPSDGGDASELRGMRSIGLASAGELPLVAPPRIEVRGRSALLELVPDRWAGAEEAVDLAAAARTAGGPGAWWLSFWATEHDLFWALLPPEGDPVSGRVSIRAGTPGRDALDDLGRAVPGRRDGESEAEEFARYTSGPLMDTADRDRERDLADRLGRTLLPTVLVDELARAAREGDGLVPLVISPSMEIASVPWCLLGLSHDDVPGGTRLHDLADWRLAPPVALLDLIGRRTSPSAEFPIEVAVIDSLADLPGADQLRSSIPPSATRLTGRHGAGWGPATVSALSAALADADHDATMVFAGHCETLYDDRPSSSGVRLLGADLSSVDNLTATDLMLGRSGAVHERFPLPSRVILAACDSAGTGSFRSGEWLSVGPAALFAGADVVVATQFTIEDDPTVERAIVRAIGDGRSLAQIVHDMVQSELDLWRSGAGRPPLHWAPFALIGRWESEIEEEGA